MTSKCTTSPPAAITDSTSSPRRAKSADRIEGAMSCMRSSLSHAATLANCLVRHLDLLRALLGAFEHRVGQAIGLQLVGMVAAHLPAVCLHDLLIAHRRGGLEQAVGLRNAILPARPGTRARAHAGSSALLAPSQDVLQARELRRAQSQQ